MNQRNIALVLAAIVAAVAVTATGFTIPQQALAGGHNHHKNNGIKVDQQVNQLNNCTGPGPQPPRAELVVRVPPTVCVNQGDNQADIQR